eukprot:gene633-5957_t
MRAHDLAIAERDREIRRAAQAAAEFDQVGDDAKKAAQVETTPGAERKMAALQAS